MNESDGIIVTDTQSTPIQISTHIHLLTTAHTLTRLRIQLAPCVTRLKRNWHNLIYVEYFQYANHSACLITTLHTIILCLRAITIER